MEKWVARLIKSFKVAGLLVKHEILAIFSAYTSGPFPTQLGNMDWVLFGFGCALGVTTTTKVTKIQLVEKKLSPMAYK